MPKPQKISFTPQMGLALLGAAGSFFSMANPFVRLPALILVFPFSLACLALTSQTNAKALKAGYLCGVLASTASLYWIALPVHDYGDLPWVLAASCPTAMGLYLGLYPGLWCWLLARTKNHLPPLAWGAFAGLTWVSLEGVRSWLFTGFPWQTLSVALVPWTWAIQSLGLIGAFGLSGVLAACGACLAQPKARPRLAAVGLLALLAVYGLWAVNRDIPVDGEFTAGIIQGNVDQSSKWEPAYQADTVNKYLELSRQTLRDKPDIIFWPETAMPLDLELPGKLVSQIMAFVGQNNVPLVAGGPGFGWANGRERIYNRAFLLTPGMLRPAYDKEHLVPFGEYAPFGQDLPILDFLLQGVGSFTAGVMVAPIKLGRLAMGMLICYESIFPELAEKRVDDGANILVNLSNDAWFGLSAAPRQHLELAVMRAVEQGRYMVRCTNTGISTVIDPRGHVLEQGPLFQEAALTMGHIGLISQNTVYHAAHGWLEGFCVLAGLGLYLFAVRKNN